MAAALLPRNLLLHSGGVLLQNGEGRRNDNHLSQEILRSFNRPRWIHAAACDADDDGDDEPDDLTVFDYFDEVEDDHIMMTMVPSVQDHFRS